ncbi:MAG: 1-deoxy-D-xylulose-5-phosphate reductoisomerase [Pseudomonadota bacterium]
MDPKGISILGSTGSVGQSTLSVIDYVNAQTDDPVFEIEALAAGKDVETLAKQALKHRAKFAVIADPSLREDLNVLLADSEVEVAAGPEAMTSAAARPCHRVVAAIVGSAGVASTLAAVQAGNDVALANKETLICASGLIFSEAKKSGARIIPMDSEHSAIFQVLGKKCDVEKLILTASGGPFRTTPVADMVNMTVEQARNHPRWSMGLKISIDSATLMNKALEVIEAAYLFDMGPDEIDVVIHPQSIIHSLVSYRDGSVLAQLGEPDMRTPIAYALSWPEDRIGTEVKRLDLAALAQLDFEEVDATRFKAIDLAKRALTLGGTAPLILNCANEAAVAAFIAGECGFMDISSTVLETLERFELNGFSKSPPSSVEEIAFLDAEGRRIARDVLSAAT